MVGKVRITPLKVQVSVGKGVRLAAGARMVDSEEDVTPSLNMVTCSSMVVAKTGWTTICVGYIKIVPNPSTWQAGPQPVTEAVVVGDELGDVLEVGLEDGLEVVLVLVVVLVGDVVEHVSG